MPATRMYALRLVPVNSPETSTKHDGLYRSRITPGDGTAREELRQALGDERVGADLVTVPKAV